MPESEIGEVIQFFAKPVVAGLALKGTLNVGDTLHINGHTTDIKFVVDSIQIDNESKTKVGRGKDVGIKVPDRVRPGDKVYKVS
jgi:putative protease